MAIPTLYQALKAFDDQYREALATKSKRLIERFNQDWQQISNDWDLYFQAKAEGLSTEADAAIADMVAILGPPINTSVLPNIGGIVSEFDGVVAVVPGAQKISFTGAFPSSAYRLTINCHDGSGVPVLYTLGAKEADGFNITPSFAATVEYNAKLL